MSDNTIDLKIGNSGPVPESSNHFSGKADSVVSVTTNIEGDNVTTFIFLDNYPIVDNDHGELSVTGIEKRRVASISIGTNKARKFYESLKNVFEDK